MSEIVRFTQVGVEALKGQSHVTATLRASQVGVEFLVPHAEPGATLRFSQVGVELLVPFSLRPDVISASSVAPGVIEIVRTEPGAGDSFTLERNQGAGFIQVGDPVDPSVLIVHDETFDPLGDDPVYRTRLASTDIPSTVVSNEEEVDLPEILGPDQPTIDVVEIDGFDAVTDHSVVLRSSPYEDSLGRTIAGVDWEVRTAGGVIVATRRVLVLDPDDSSWLDQLLDALTSPGDTLYGYVRHLAIDPEYDSPVPGAWSAGVEFDLLGEVDGEEGSPSELTVGEETYKSQYPYGTFATQVGCPEFDQDETVCPGAAVPWFGIAWRVPNGNSIIKNDGLSTRLAAFTFARGGTKPSVDIIWFYRCYTPSPGLLKSYGTSAASIYELPFCPDTPFVFERSNISAGQKVTESNLLFRWWEDGRMMCAGASVNQSTDGGVRDPAFRSANSELLFDGGLFQIYRLAGFGGTWTIEAVQNGVVYPLGTLPFGHRDFIASAGGDDWLHRDFYNELGEVDEVGWEMNLDLSGLPDGVTQIRVTLDGRVARLTHPFMLDRLDQSVRYAGMDLRVADLSFGGSEGEEARWEDLDDGGVRRIGAANTVGHAALPEMGNPRTLEVIVSGAFATRKSVVETWGLMFLPDADSGWGAGAYLATEDNYSAIAALLRGSGPPVGYNRAVNQGEGASSASWWNAGPRHGRGVGMTGLRRIGPRAIAPEGGTVSGSGTFEQWSQSGVGLGPFVNAPLRPIYSLRLRVELLAINIDGSHLVRVTHQVVGPGVDTSILPRSVRTIAALRWDCGLCGLFAETREGGDGSVVEFYSVSVLPEDFGDCAYDASCDTLIPAIEPGPAEEEIVPAAPVLYPISPDWGDGVRERFHWMTDIITAADGLEQRIQLRAVPGRTLEYSPLSLSAPEAALGDGILFARQAGRIYVPQWQHSTFLLAAAAAAAEVVACNAVQRGFAVGAKVLLWVSPTIWEIAEISEIASGSLELTAGLDSNFAAWSTQVIPLAVGLVPAELRTERAATFASKPGAVFRLEVVGASLPAAPEVSPATYRDLPILPFAPDRNGALTDESQRLTDLVDNQTGRFASRPRSSHSPLSRSLQFTLFGRDEIHTMLGLVWSLQGQVGPIWIPTYGSDLPLAAPIAAGSTTVLIQYVGYSASLFSRLERRDIAFVAPTGTIVARRVLAAEDLEDGTEELTLDEAVSETEVFAVESLVSFLHLCRLASDTFMIDWQTQEVAIVELETREIPFEVPT